MIDNFAKALVLIEKLKTALPLDAHLSPGVMRLLAEKSPEMHIPERCQITAVHYAGDEGGIVCHLDIGGAEAKNAHFVSITHLGFRRNASFHREIGVYQRHRLKMLKQQDARGS